MFSLFNYVSLHYHITVLLFCRRFQSFNIVFALLSRLRKAVNPIFLTNRLLKTLLVSLNTPLLTAVYAGTKALLRALLGP